jgi:8-oxo-dGTP diphosphatase
VTEELQTVRLTADVVLFGDFEGDLWVLLIERGWDPFKGCWALPGGHCDPTPDGVGEDTEDTAHRELTEETGIRVGHLAYVGAYATPGRDPRGRYVTFAYVGRMPHRFEPTAGDDAVRAEWVRVDDVLNMGRLAFDHEQIIRDAMRVGIAGQMLNPEPVHVRPSIDFVAAILRDLSMGPRCGAQGGLTSAVPAEVTCRQCIALIDLGRQDWR